MLLLAIVALGVPLALSLRDRVDAEVRAQASNQADVVAATAAELLIASRRTELQRLVGTASHAVRGRVIVVDAGGRLIADSAGSTHLGTDYGQRPEIRLALSGRRRAPDTRRSATLGTELLATAAPIVRAGRPAGAVRITQSVDAVARAVRRATLGLALVAAVVLALGLGAGLLIAGQVARPLRRLDAAARRVAGGDLDARATVDGSSEQRSLARSFNEMTDRLGRLLRAQQEFVADASHQLRTPLTGLRLRLESARASVADGSDSADDLDAGLREVDRLALTVEELLVLSRAGERELPGEHVDLGAAAARAVDRWQPAAAERRIGLRHESSDSPGAAWCAAPDLDRAIDALVENALRYAHAGTSVTVAAGRGAIEVIDEGPGIAPGEEQQIFERFYRGRTGRQGEPGTGLGLPIARELAREWGGSVTLTNRPERGVVARIELPADSGAQRVAAHHQVEVLA